METTDFFLIYFFTEKISVIESVFGLGVLSWNELWRSFGIILISKWGPQGVSNHAITHIYFFIFTYPRTERKIGHFTHLRRFLFVFTQRKWPITHHADLYRGLVNDRSSSVKISSSIKMIPKLLAIRFYYEFSIMNFCVNS